MHRRAISPQGGVWWAALCAEQLASSEPPDTYERLVEQARLAESPTLTSAAAASTAAAAFTITITITLHRHRSPLTAHHSPFTRRRGSLSPPR